MKTATTREAENRCADIRAMFADQRLAGVKVMTLENNHGAALGSAAPEVGTVDPAFKAGSVEGHIVRSEPIKAPAKDSAEKITACLRVDRGKLDIVDPVMLRFELIMHGGVRHWLVERYQYDNAGTRKNRAIHIQVISGGDTGGKCGTPGARQTLRMHPYRLGYGHENEGRGHKKNKKRGAFAPLLVCSN
jgi:hypothetical protein